MVISGSLYFVITCGYRGLLETHLGDDKLLESFYSHPSTENPPHSREPGVVPVRQFVHT